MLVPTGIRVPAPGQGEGLSGLLGCVSESVLEGVLGCGLEAVSERVCIRGCIIIG